MASPFSLLTKARFAPLFATSLLGTLNDHLFKTTLLMMLSYGVLRTGSGHAGQLAAVATAVYILPFFLASALAGQMADACERARTVRVVKAAEVAIMGLGLAGFVSHSLPLLLATLFLLGLHSAVYGPVRNAILPLHLGEASCSAAWA